ncbi:HAD family hydrolase [Bdellovibrio sp. HCB117]|uniref:HAD family hydrolase n=1 Tax=Bdellovibrio sp. HCB117 TaxID=3394359 RepID=UPI0039B623CE
MKTLRGIILDVDGTLIDSNHAHAESWVRALGEYGIVTTYAEVREKIGMGGDNLLPAVSDIEEDSKKGKKISRRRSEIFQIEYLPYLKPFKKTRQLIQFFQQEGVKMVVASSSSKEDLQGLLKMAHVDDLLPQRTSKDDVEVSKPAPDIIQAALKKLQIPASNAVMLGDTPYDIIAAKKAGVETIALTCGGWSAKDLSGAVAIYRDPEDFLWHLEKNGRPEISGDSKHR